MSNKIVEKALHIGEEPGSSSSVLTSGADTTGEYEDAITVSDKKGHRKKEDVRQAVLNLMFSNNQALLLVICQHSPTSDPSAIAMALIVLLQQQGLAENFLRKLFSTKLKKASAIGENDVTNLIRDNSMLSTMLIAFAQIEGQEFMKSTLSAAVKHVLNDKELIELNPAKISDKTQLERNVQRLEQYCHQIVGSLLASKELIPPLFRRICNYIKMNVDDAMKTVRKKSKEIDPSMKSLSVSLKVLSSFFFLRYLLPALTFPDKYDLIESGREMTNVERQNVIMITKVLTNLANDVEMGQKEQHMLPVNNFLKFKRPQMLQFLTFLSEAPGNEGANKPSTFSPEIIDASCTYLLPLALGVLPKLERSLEAGEANDDLKKVKDKVVQLRQTINKISAQSSRKFKFLTINGMKNTLGRSFATSGSSSGSSTMKKGTSIGRLAGKLKGRLAQQMPGDEEDEPNSPTMGMKKSVSFGDVSDLKDISSNLPPVPNYRPPSDVLDIEMLGASKRRGSILPSETNLFKSVSPKKDLLAFRGNFRLYIQKTSMSFDSYEIREDCIDILAPFLSYIWEALCRQVIAVLAIKHLGRNPQPAIVSGMLEMESALNRVIPVTIAHFSSVDRDKFPVYFQVADLQKDFSRLLKSDENLRMSIFGLPDTLIALDAPSAARMVNVLDYIYYRVLKLTAESLSSAPRKFFRASDILNTIRSDPSLHHLFTMCTTSELRQPWLPPPLFDDGGNRIMQQPVIVTGLPPLQFEEPGSSPSPSTSSSPGTPLNRSQPVPPSDAVGIKEPVVSPKPVVVAGPLIVPVESSQSPFNFPISPRNQAQPFPPQQQQQQPFATNDAQYQSVPHHYHQSQPQQPQPYPHQHQIHRQQQQYPVSPPPQQQQQQQQHHPLVDAESIRQMQQLQMQHQKQQQQVRQQQALEARRKQEQLRQQQYQLHMNMMGMPVGNQNRHPSPQRPPQQQQFQFTDIPVPVANDNNNNNNNNKSSGSSSGNINNAGSPLIARGDFKRLDTSKRISHSWSPAAGDLIFDNPMLVKGRPFEPTGVDSFGARDGYQASGRPTVASPNISSSGVFNYIY